MQLVTHGLEQAATRVGPISWINIDMLRMETEGTVVTTGLLRRRHILAALLADEAVIDLLEAGAAFLTHNDSNGLTVF